MAHSIQEAFQDELGDPKAEIVPERHIRDPKARQAAKDLKRANLAPAMMRRLVLNDPFTKAEATGGVIVTGHGGGLDALDGDWSDDDFDDLNFDLG